MTNEEAKMFLDNLKICIDEHPIVADWLVEIADRKTEPQNDCEGCKHYVYQLGCTHHANCAYEPQTERSGE